MCTVADIAHFKCYLASCSNCEKDTANLDKTILPSNKADDLSDDKEPSVCDGILYYQESKLWTLGIADI